jgi:hypothetical protein
MQRTPTSVYDDETLGSTGDEYATGATADGTEMPMTDPLSLSATADTADDAWADSSTTARSDLSAGSETSGSGAGEERLQHAATDLAGQARQLAETRVNDTVSTAADQLHRVADAVRESSSGLREQQPQIARVAEQAAEQVDRAASYLGNRDVRELLDEAERFARREPMLVLAGGFAVGLVAARILRMTTGGGQASGGQSHDGLTAGGPAGYGADGSSLALGSGAAYVGGGRRI